MITLEDKNQQRALKEKLQTEELFQGGKRIEMQTHVWESIKKNNSQIIYLANATQQVSLTVE